MFVCVSVSACEILVASVQSCASSSLLWESLLSDILHVIYFVTPWLYFLLEFDTNPQIDFDSFHTGPLGISSANSVLHAHSCSAAQVSIYVILIFL